MHVGPLDIFNFVVTNKLQVAPATALICSVSALRRPLALKSQINALTRTLLKAGFRLQGRTTIGPSTDSVVAEWDNEATSKGISPSALTLSPPFSRQVQTSTTAKDIYEFPCVFPVLFPISLFHLFFLGLHLRSGIGVRNHCIQFFPTVRFAECVSFSVHSILFALCIAKKPPSTQTLRSTSSLYMPHFNLPPIMPREPRTSVHPRVAVAMAPYPQQPPHPSTSASVPRNAAIWSTTDDEILLQARATGMNWQPIASRHFPNKTANACRKRHERLIERRE